jgi:hypothetical protein
MKQSAQLTAAMALMLSEPGGPGYLNNYYCPTPRMTPAKCHRRHKARKRARVCPVCHLPIEAAEKP